ncbi:MAG: hypothetical protein D3918_13150 [Candidatus Electrothrix sp. AX2]|nr:hypothetical protein [Candidatus Electrothrix gigas]
MKNILIVFLKNTKENLALCFAVALIIVGFANSALANHFLEVRVWKFHLPSPTYHSDVTFNTNTPYLAFGPEKNMSGGVVGVVSIPGKIVWTKRFFTNMPYTPEGGKRFWQIKDELLNKWNRYSYNLANRNCNHFVDAVLRRYGAGSLPGKYFSRGDHLDKQVWHWTAQGIGLSPEEADRIGKEWNKARNTVTTPLKKAEDYIKPRIPKLF